MGSCSGLGLLCQLAGLLTQHMEVTIVITISVVISWQIGYSKGKEDAGCGKSQREFFVYGIMHYLQVKNQISLSLSECDEFIKEAVSALCKGEYPKIPSKG